MRGLRSGFKAFMIMSVAAVQLMAPVLTYPAILHAQEAVSEPVPCVAPEDISRPTGTGSQTYTWSCERNLWENDYFTWDPATHIATPKFAPEHKFNEELNLWQVWEWVYIPTTASYQLRVTSSYAPAVTEAVTPPAGGGATIDTTGPDSTNGLENSDGTIQNTGPNSTNTITNTDGTITTTGPDSSNTIALDGVSSADLNIDTDIDVTNDVDSAAVSGDASVLQNTTAGSALTGDASAIANILNMLQSTWGWNGGLTPEIYTADIQGDYFGDIMIDPSLLGIQSGGCGCGDLTVNASLDASITNNVNLLAQSGDATVSMNTSAGDAATGNATAVANIINMINSSITAGESFLGILNIHGNFEGDVLVAQDVIDELIAANVPTTQITMCDCGVMADFTANMSTANNISTTATSGNAAVTDNTLAGNATSGSAETSVTVFNVTGRTIVGQNALLVFVNVLGEWVGFIVDAPAGATAAAFGGNLTQNSISGDTEINSDTNMSITNNVNVAAVSGDAKVSYNTRAGNATSGDASASANVSNILGSNFSLSGWFGLLFINILGDWFGSFGVNTPYGNTTLPEVGGTDTPVGQVLASQHGGSSRSGSFVRRKPSSNVRVFEAAFEEAESGGMTLANVTEALPSSTDTEQNFGAPSSNQQAFLGWVLISMGTSMFVYFVRRRPLA